MKKDQDDDDDGGDSGGNVGGGIVPTYYDLIGGGVDEKEINALAEQALFEQRISIKSKGYEVTALSKLQKLRNRLQEPEAGVNEAGGIDLEAHPELADMAGDIDPNTIVLPESEAIERASNDPKLQNKLRARLAAKLGMGQGMSLQSLQEEYKKKMRMRSSPQPEPSKPRYRPASPTPKPRPY